MASYDGYILAFKERFFDIDNVSYFETLSRDTPGMKWIGEPTEFLPGHRYLFGARA